MKDLGEAKKVLSMEIEREHKGGKVILMQKEYLKKVLQQFNINDDSKSVSTPLTPHFKLKTIISSITVEEREYMTHMPYVSLAGSLMYAMRESSFFFISFSFSPFSSLFKTTLWLL